MTGLSSVKGTKLLIPLLTTLVIELALLTLGVWQIERRTLKHALIARVEAGLAAPPHALPAQDTWNRLNAQETDYQKVTVSGHFLHEREALLYMLYFAEQGREPTPGYAVITPLLLDGGGVLLVNRGYVPDAKLNPASRAQAQTSGPVTVTGLLRSSEKRSWFSPDDQPAKKQFYTRDVAFISQSLGLAALGKGPVAPFLLEADATANPGGWPKGGQTVVQFTDNHLLYALTWFSLALGILILFGVWYRQNRHA